MGEVTLVEKLSFMTILCHFGRVIQNIRINLVLSFRTFMSHWTIFLSYGTFLVILNKTQCFLLVSSMACSWSILKILRILKILNDDVLPSSSPVLCQ